MLALEQRRNADKRSIEELDAVVLLLKELVATVKGKTIFMEKELDRILDLFMGEICHFIEQVFEIKNA